MNTVFSGDSIGIMVFSAILCSLLPLIYLGYYKAKTGAKLSSFFIGVGMSLLFSYIVSSLLAYILLILFGLKDVFNVSVHPVYTALYSAVLAGVTTEVGSYVGLKFCMKSHPGKQDAFVFGLGKGGLECIIYGGIVNITNIMMALLVNQYGINGYLSKTNIPASEVANQTKNIQAIADIPGTTILLNASQYILALCLHTALAILIYFAITYKPYKKLFPIAVLLHCIGYIPVYLNQAGILNNMTVVMTISLFYTFIIMIFAYRLYNLNVKKPYTP